MSAFSCLTTNLLMLPLLGNLWLKTKRHLGTPDKPHLEYSWSLSIVSLPLPPFCILHCRIRIIEKLLHIDGKFIQTIWQFLFCSARKAN